MILYRQSLPVSAALEKETIGRTVRRAACSIDRYINLIGGEGTSNNNMRQVGPTYGSNNGLLMNDKFLLSIHPTPWATSTERYASASRDLVKEAVEIACTLCHHVRLKIG